MQGGFVTGNVSALREDDELALWQAERLHAVLPILCLAVIANSLAMATAVLGDLPWWQQILPPALIVTTLLVVLGWRYFNPPASNVRKARRHIAVATGVAAVLGLTCGAWGVNAFDETDKYYCMVAPVFLGLSALVSASCLFSVPRAALTAMACTIVPIGIKLAVYPNLGTRAMAAMAVGLCAMQAGIVLATFKQTRRTLALQRELTWLASTDALTGLANRRGFEAGFESLLESGRPVAVIMLDLNGFKQANDRYGHHVGDQILIDVALRLREAAPGVKLLARLGGDEFCLVCEECHDWQRLMPLIERIATAIARPLDYAEGRVAITTSVGAAIAPEDGDHAHALLHTADARLYADKRGRSTPPRLLQSA